MTRYCLALLALICSFPVSADLVRINLRAVMRPPLHGFIVYDSDAAPNGSGPTTSFDWAIHELEFGGVKGINPTILMTDDSIEFRSENGLRIVFAGSASLAAGVLPDVFPDDWTSRSWHSDSPFFGERLGDLIYVSYSDPDPEHTAVLFVGNDGSDSATCGYEWQRCRSISQAIRNSHDGDTILVGPGIYGDIDQSGGIFGPGEEGSSFCFCLVFVDKRITILSERGADATIIDARDTPFTIVQIFAPGAVFGFSGYGFTLLGAGGFGGGPLAYGIEVEEYVVATVWGNRVLGGGGNREVGIVARAGAHVYDNEVSGYLWGILVETGRIVGNNVRQNGSPFGPTFGAGIATHRAAVENNVVEANSGDGVWFRGPTAATTIVYVTGNDIVGNGRRGIRLEDLSNNPLDASMLAVQDNNIVGNDRAHSDSMRCGLENKTGGVVWAPYNYWGPPEDQDRSCDGAGSTTITEPMRLEPHVR
jgi:hypothetical protein